MKTGYYAVATLLLLAGLQACKPKVKYDMKINLTRLTRDNMYDQNLVADVIFDAHELKVDSLKDKSNKLFLKGVDLFKNKKDPAAGLEVLKQSALTFPQVDTYYVMGEALMAMQDNATGDDKKAKLREALQAYQVAVSLHYQPASFAYYNMARAENLLGNDDSIHGVDKFALHYNHAVADLRNAFMNGFNDTAMLKNDTKLNAIIKTEAYKQMLAELNARKKPDSKPETVFDLYKDLYPNVQQPFVIALNEVGMDSFKTEISFDFAKFVPEMENTEFSREVSHDYYVVGKLAETPLYTAVIYTSTEFDDIERGAANEPVITKLVTYTPEGKIIDTRIISCRCTPEKEKTVRIEKNIITTQEYNVEWKYSAEEMAKSFNPDSGTTTLTNKIVKSEPVGKEVYKINDIGKIVVSDEQGKVALN